MLLMMLSVFVQNQAISGVTVLVFPVLSKLSQWTQHSVPVHRHWFEFLMVTWQTDSELSLTR